MPVVDADSARAVAENVGGTCQKHDRAVLIGVLVVQATRDGADEARLVGEGEGAGGVNAALGGGGAEDGEDFALVALDDGEVAVGEECLDGLSAEGGCAGTALRLSVFRGSSKS